MTQAAQFKQGGTSIKTLMSPRVVEYAILKINNKQNYAMC
jgi:hypothetical protein